MKFRPPRADEIEVRVGTVSEKGCSLLLYKDARFDMTLLDETVGAENWQRKHELINGKLFCSVGIWCDEEWVWKQDVGVESNTEATKGEASDAFKRACTNWGCGRELYTAPFIWVGAEGTTLVPKGNKMTTYDKFKVTEIAYDDKGNIVSLAIENIKRHQIVYKMGEAIKSTPKTLQADNEPNNEPQDNVEEAALKARVIAYVNKTGMSKENIAKLCKYYHVESLNQLNKAQCSNYLSQLEKKGIVA